MKTKTFLSVFLWGYLVCLTMYAEAEQLIAELLALEDPYHCPHGRPTIISLSKRELEKKFKRIV